jgi:hypothetical protein
MWTLFGDRTQDPHSFGARHATASRPHVTLLTIRTKDVGCVVNVTLRNCSVRLTMCARLPGCVCRKKKSALTQCALCISRRRPKRSLSLQCICGVFARSAAVMAPLERACVIGTTLKPFLCAPVSTPTPSWCWARTYTARASPVRTTTMLAWGPMGSTQSCHSHPPVIRLAAPLAGHRRPAIA